MTSPFFWLVVVGVVAIATGAPVTNQEDVISPLAQASPDDGGQMRLVAKRAEEMMYYGNQQNEPRVTMKKKWGDDLFQYMNYPQAPLGELDEGGSMVVHPQVPVDEELKARAETIKGPSESERLEEATKIAMEEAEKGSENGAGNDVSEGGNVEEGVSEGGDEGVSNNNENIVNAVEEDNTVGVDQVPAVPESEGVEEDGTATDDAELDLPETVESSNDGGDSPSVEPDLITKTETNENEGDKDSDEEDIENIGDVTPLSSEEEEGTNDNDGSKENSDEEVEEFLEELRHESEEGDNEAVPNYPEDGPTDFPVYSGRPFYMWPNGKPAPPPTGRLADYLRYSAPYVPLVRDSFRRRRRRSGHVRRIKRGLRSDWLAAYSGLDIPMSSEDVEDSLLSDPEESYEYEPVNDELSRYIYGNLLNKLANSYRGVDADVEEEIPYEEILPYELDSDMPKSMMDDDEPEELLYDPDYLRDSPYNDVIPSYDYRKRSGGLDYYPDSRRKRYFYPAYNEPETHWGAFVPEKRNYDDAIERLQRLAMSLSDNPRPYYENLLREYKKK